MKSNKGDVPTCVVTYTVWKSDREKTDRGPWTCVCRDYCRRKHDKTTTQARAIVTSCLRSYDIPTISVSIHCQGSYKKKRNQVELCNRLR